MWKDFDVIAEATEILDEMYLEEWEVSEVVNILLRNAGGVL